MTALMRATLPCVAGKGLHEVIYGFPLLVRSLAVLHESVYAAASAPALLPVQHVACVPAQLQAPRQHSLPANSCGPLEQPMAFMSPANPARGQLGTYQAVIAAVSDSGQMHSKAVQAASIHLLDAIQQLKAKLKDKQEQTNIEAEMQQLTQQMQHHAQQAVIPVDQLLPLLTAVLQLPRPPLQLVQMLVSCTMQTVPQMTPMQLSDALNCISSLPGGLQGTKRSLSKVVTAYLQQQQSISDAASTAAVAAALARCKQHSSFTVLSMLAMDHMQEMSGQQLVQLLSAFAEVQHYNQAVNEAAVRSTIRLLHKQGYRLQDSSISQPTAADQHSIQSPGQLAEQQGGVLTANNLVQLLSSCADLRHHDAQLLEAAAMAVVRSLKSLQLSQVVKVVTTCTQLNHYSAGLFEEACRLAQQALAEQQQLGTGTGHPSFRRESSRSRTEQLPLDNNSSSGPSSRDSLVDAITNLAWSCALMDHLDVSFWQQVAIWSSSLAVDRMSEGQLLRWFQVQSCLTDAAVSNPEFRTLGLGNHLLLAAQEAWLQKLQGQSLTAFHKEVHEALKQAGARCRLNVALDGPLVVDVALQTVQRLQAKSRVAVQLETPDMFAANPPYTALGPTAARWRALQTRGWKVISLRYSDWRRLKTAEDRTLFMWNIKEAISSRGPGLAPDVVQTGTSAGTKHSKQPQTASAIGKKLWKMFVD